MAIPAPTHLIQSLLVTLALGVPKNNAETMPSLDHRLCSIQRTRKRGRIGQKLMRILVPANTCQCVKTLRWKKEVHVANIASVNCCVCPMLLLVAVTVRIGHQPHDTRRQERDAGYQIPREPHGIHVCIQFSLSFQINGVAW